MLTVFVDSRHKSLSSGRANSEQPPLPAARPMARDASGKRPRMRFARLPGRPRLLFSRHQVIFLLAATGLDECDNPALLLQ
jgi:hypothetical protein